LLTVLIIRWRAGVGGSTGSSDGGGGGGGGGSSSSSSSSNPISAQDWTGLEGSRKLRYPHFKTTGI